MLSATQVINRETLCDVIDMWATEYHLALGNRSTYGSKHRGFHQDARKICRQVRAVGIEGTIFDYINEVFRDANKRGYDDELHYPGLKAGYLAWTRSADPVPDWNPPGGIPPLPEFPSIRSSKEVCKQSPAVDLLEQALKDLEAAQPEEEEKVEEDEVREPRSKGKQKAKEITGDRQKTKGGTGTSRRGKGARVKSAAVVKDDEDDEEDADADADGEPETNDPPCTRCIRMRVACEVKGTEVRGSRAPAACLPCNRLKCACSLVTKPKAAENAEAMKASSSGFQDVPHGRQPVGEGTPPAQLPKRRRKTAPRVIAAGLAGEFSVDPAGIPVDVKEKLALLERTDGELLERLANLEEHFVRVQIENQSIQNWYAQRLAAMAERLRITEAQAVRTMSACQYAACEDPEKRRKWTEHLQAASLYMGIPCPAPPPMSPPPNHPVPGPSSSIPDSVPPEFFAGMTLVPQAPVVPTTLVVPTGAPVPRSPSPGCGVTEGSTEPLVLYPPSPAPAPIFLVAQGPPAILPPGEMTLDDHLLPPPSSRRSHSPSVSNTFHAQGLAARSKRPMPSLDEEEDNNPAKKQKTM